MKTVFVTGISGLLGTNLALDLLDSGYRVLGLVRSRTRYKGVSHPNLDLIEGSFEDDLSRWLNSAEAVVHVAAETRQNLTDYSDYLKVNCEVTRNLFDTAAQCAVKKFVFVSTANTMGFGSLEDPGHEGKEVRFPFSASYYARSKIEAENYVLGSAASMETIVVNPTFMLGPYDTKPSSGKIILMGWKKRFVFYPPGGKNFVHVKDVSAGILRALDRGRHGERYLLANENLSYREFYEKLNVVADQNARLVGIPKSALMLLGHFGDLLRSMGIRSSLSTTNTRILCVDNYYSNLKSREELGLDYSSTDKSIRDAIDYFSSQG
jgi:nucleoside-diphosphate-sugar epimerase